MNRARRIVQLTGLALTLVGVFYFRAHAESWCPFGGVEALYTYFREGNLLCSLGVSNFYALAALIASVALVRRAFCGYLCPIGAISEGLRTLAARLGVPALRVPAKVDRAAALVKYAILAAIVAATWQAGELVFRGYCPAYALVGRHGADITFWAYVVAGGIAAASLVVAMPFCRWFCPLAAAINPLSRFGVARVRRDRNGCTECGRCSAACPMAIPVDRLEEVRHARCLACWNCVDACPSRKRPLTWGPPRWLGGSWPRATVWGVLVLGVTAAVLPSSLAPLPSFVKTRGTPPERTAVVELRIRDLTCRGRANLLVGFLDRDDLYAIADGRAGTPGYYELEAWPGPDPARVRITYDPARTEGDAIRRAITEPYFDAAANRWWLSPFSIDGYTVPGLRP